MTKEEYEGLLQSDYWKGYSYSLIKERNFTCEDCGRSFPNERHMLQVHHLVYRDANPWSYKPEELVVLCKECHQKRHGIYQGTTTSTAPRVATNNQYTQSYSSSYNTSERGYQKESGSAATTTTTTLPRKTKRLIGLSLAAFAICMALVLWLPSLQKQKTPKETQHIDYSNIITTPQPATEQPAAAKPKAEQQKATITKKAEHKQTEPLAAPAAEIKDTKPLEVPAADNEVALKEWETAIDDKITKEKTTLELLEEKNHANAVKRAQEAGVSTEGSTLDILQRIQHADAVKRAQEAGVSTEGSTLDILERLNRKNL